MNSKKTGREDRGVDCATPKDRPSAVSESRASSPCRVQVLALVPFLMITFGLAWGILGLYVFLPQQMARLFGQLTGNHPLFFLAVYAPAIAAIIIVARKGGISALRRFLGRILLWRCSAAWYFFLLLGVPLIFTIGAGLKGTLFSEPFPFTSVQTLLIALVLAAIKGPVEEFGWRGLALPLLQRKMAPLWAGLVLGVIWGLWHMPAFLLSGTQQSEWSFTAFFAGCLAISVIAAELYNHSRGSILLSAFFHFTLMNPIFPDAQPYDTYMLIGVAALIVWKQRKHMLKKGNGVTHVIPHDAPCSPSQTPHTGFIVASLFAVTLGLASSVAAEEKGWAYAAGGAVVSENVYAGADETYVTPTPIFRASYDTGKQLSYFISLPLEGAGVVYKSGMHNLIGRLTLNFGGQRLSDEYSVIGIPVDHSDKTKAFLDGAPDVSTPVYLSASLQRPMNIGIIGASLGYHPTSVEYTQGGIDDKVEHGLLFSLSYTKPFQLSQRLALCGMLSMEFMDDRYADAWFSVERETASLEPFEANAGIKDVQFAIHASYSITERVALSVCGAHGVLLGDAADSPYTVEKNQQTFLAELVYRF